MDTHNRYIQSSGQLGFVILLMAFYVGCFPSKPVGTPDSTPALAELLPVTAEEALEAAERYVEFSNAQDVEGVNSCINTNALCKTVLSKMTFPPRHEEQLRLSISRHFVLEELSPFLLTPSSSLYSIIQANESEEEVSVLIRVLRNNSSIDIQELYFAKHESGTPRIVDLYSLELGERLSEYLAKVFFASNEHWLKQLSTSSNRSYQPMRPTEQLGNFIDAISSDNFYNALAIYREMPETLQNVPYIILSKTYSLIRLNNHDEIHEAIAQLQSTVNDELAITYVLIDYYLLTEQTTKAIEGLEKLYEYAPDPFFIYAMGIVYSRHGLPEEALAAYSQAMSEKLDVSDVGYEAANLAMELQKWQEAAEGLRYYERQSGRLLRSEELLDLPNMLQFIESEAGSPWKARFRRRLLHDSAF